MPEPDTSCLTLGDREQTPIAQYPCTGGCGCWVQDSAGRCIHCWAVANPLTRRQARRPDLHNHPRRPTPIPCEECHMNLAMRGHDRYCSIGRQQR